MTDSPDQSKPMRLADAAALYPGMTVSTLRTEAKRGPLVIWRVAGKDWTSLVEIDKMFEKCRVTPQEQDSGSNPPGPTTPASSEKAYGSSRTEESGIALAAALATARRLREGSPTISRKPRKPPR